MTAPANHKHQMNGPSRAGQLVGHSIHTLAAHDKAQGRTHPRPAGVSRSVLLSRLTPYLPVRTGRGFGLARFSQFNSAHHVRQDNADVPERHPKRLSCVAVSYDRDPIERTFSVAQKPGPSGAKSV